MIAPSAGDLYAADLASVATAQHLRFFPAAPVSGRGALLTEVDGRELVDLSGSWGAAGVGYAHPNVVEAVSDAVGRMAGASLLSSTNPEALALAEDLRALVPEIEDSRVYLGHAGSDANAAALRSVRAASDRPRLISFEGSYHGGLGPAQHVSGIYVSSGIAGADGRPPRPAAAGVPPRPSASPSPSLCSARTAATAGGRSRR